MSKRTTHSNESPSPDQGRPRYRLIDHTADLGFEVEAPDLEALFARAAMALHDIMADTGAAAPRLERRLSAEGGDLEDLLVRFLEEAHFAFEGERMLFATVSVARVERPDSAGGRPARVTGAARGEPFDPRRHELRRPVKAVTYHEIAVEAVPGGYRARAILDL